MALAKRIHDTLSNAISEQAYLEGELISPIRHEYIDGCVYAMAGASENHGLIAQNISRELGNFFKSKKSPCKVLSESMKIRIPSKGTKYFYPDVFVFCDPHPDDTAYYKHSPVLIAEILSSSTYKDDFTTKKLAYFNIPSLQEYVIVEQDVCNVIVFRRNDNWQPNFYLLGDAITFESIGVTLSVEDIYYQVNNDYMVNFLAHKKSPSEEPEQEQTDNRS